jgi:hypothetical protein
METLRAIAHYQLLGMPLWFWLLSCMPVVNELINRSKWTKAQSLWQFCWRLVAATPLASIPRIGAIVQMMAVPKDMRATEVFPDDITKKLGPSILILFFLPMATACSATLEASMYKSAYTVASGAQTCFLVVDEYDEIKQNQIRGIKTLEEASTVFTEWKKTRDAALTSCKAGRLSAESARALIPVIMAAKDRDKQAAAWIARMATLASEVAKAVSSVSFGGK